MMLRFIRRKRLVWVEDVYGHIHLGRLKRYVYSEDHYDFRIYVKIWSWSRMDRVILRIETHAWGEILPKLKWGEYRPFWQPPIEEEDVDSHIKIRINERAKTITDERLRKTRTLQQVWEQG